MSFEQALSVALAYPNDEAALSTLAKAALSEGREDMAIPLIEAAAERGSTPLLWQWAALLERSIDNHERAIIHFERAAILAPNDRSIAHGRARVALEAGVPAERLFEVALRLSPGDSAVMLGYSAALFAGGNAVAAERTLASILERSPQWTDGHVQLAQLRSIAGKKDQAAASLESSLVRNPRDENLWAGLFRLLVQMEKFAELDDAVARARRHAIAEYTLVPFETIAAIEQAETDRADRLLAAIPPTLRKSIEIWSIRHLLRTGRIAAATAAIDSALKADIARHVWPYASVAWRLSGDPRWDWLEGDLDRMVSVIDLSPELGDLDALEDVLRSLHQGQGEFLDQSVRGGSQTDGPLFTRIDPRIRTLRSAVVSAVRKHVDALPKGDPAHPLLGGPRDRPIRFSGSWSVRLRAGGYHSNHVHPQGWISSAFYIRLPHRRDGDAKNAGWLTLGEPQVDLQLQLGAYREVEPKVGRLVLFPSYMWHGTRPFEEGERITVAFDVQPPT